MTAGRRPPPIRRGPSSFPRPDRYGPPPSRHAGRCVGEGTRLCQGARTPRRWAWEQGDPMPAVQLTAVSKTYRRRGRPPQKAIDNLDLLVESGGVHGFLGPNGSGKTTSIRVLLGLVSADSGTARIFDRPVPQALPDVVGSVGALVENPLFL